MSDRECVTTDSSESNLVHPEDGCPRCRERDVDPLMWDADGTKVTCAVCGMAYVPGEVDA